MPTGGEEEGILGKAEELGRRLRARGLTLAVAESCTGGGLADAITDVAGSSDYFPGGIVAYANRAKERVLGVDPETLAAHGAVSEQVARQMAAGVREALGADLGVGITGIAGPGGGTGEKPVGLVYIALALPAGEERSVSAGGLRSHFASYHLPVRRYVWSADRIGNKRLSVEAALDLLLEHVAAP